MNRLTPAQQQIPLALPMDPTLQEELMLQKASELYRRSRLLGIPTTRPRLYRLLSTQIPRTP